MYRRVARMTLVATIATAVLSYVSLEKKVTVVIEGESVAVRTFAPSVGETLDRAGIKVAPKDHVAPSLGTEIGGGERIIIRRAKPVTLVVDGEPEKLTVTALRIEGALEEAGFDLRPQDVVTPGPNVRVRPGQEIRYRPADRVAVKIGPNAAKQVVTTKPRVGGVLDQLGVKLREFDRVVPPIGSLHNGGRIQVLRVRHETSSRTESIPFSTVTRRTSSLEHGSSKVANEGREGLARIRYQTVYVNGTTERTDRLDRVVVRQPVDRLVLVGTGYPGCGCDRGFQAGKASWYGEADGMTAAHKTLPFGTVVRVENVKTGKAINVTIRDRGPFIAGRIIDLSDEAFAMLASLGSGVIDVRIRW